MEEKHEIAAVLSIVNKILSRYPELKNMLQVNENRTEPGRRIWMIGESIIQELADANNTSWDLGTNNQTITIYPRRNLEFVVDKIPTFFFPYGWTGGINDYGGIQAHSERRNASVNIWELCNHKPCLLRNMPCTIGNVLVLAPLNVQAIALEFGSDEIIGRSGIHALATKTVAINNALEAQRYCKEHQLTLAQFVRQKAEQLNFRSVLP